MDYLGGLVSSIFSMIFVVFVIGAVGYFLGAIKVKGISLGTAGVLLAALLFGVLASYVSSFHVGEKEIVLFDAAKKTSFSLVSNIVLPQLWPRHHILRLYGHHHHHARRAGDDPVYLDRQ